MHNDSKVSDMQPDPSPENWLTVETAADLLGVSIATVRHYARTGRLTRYTRTPRNRVFFDRHEVEAMLTPVRYEPPTRSAPHQPDNSGA